MAVSGGILTRLAVVLEVMMGDITGTEHPTGPVSFVIGGVDYLSLCNEPGSIYKFGSEEGQV